MSSGAQRPFVSVKFSPVGRTYSFLIPELALDADAVAAEPEGAAALPPKLAPVAPLSPGDAVIVQTADGRALGTVTRAVPALALKKLPPPDSELQVVRKATRDDIVTRLKHQQREQDAQRICLMKIRERGLAMKLAR